MIKAPTPITLEELKAKFPKKKNSITQEAVDLINATLLDPEFDTTTFINDMITYENVMHSSSLSVEEYVNAIRFCAYLQSNPDSVLEAYKRTFANRESVQSRWNAEPGTSDYNQLTSMAARYNMSPAVTKIKTQAAVPMHILFAGYGMQAIQVLATEMTTAYQARDRINAAKELLAAVKAPDKVKVEVDIGVKENTAIQSLNEQLAMIASTQMAHLTSGTATLNQFGALKPKDEDVIDVD